MIAQSKLRLMSIAAIVASGALFAFCFVYFRKSFAAGYLVAFGYWIALWLGAVGLLNLHELTGGRWGVAIGPILRKIARAFPVTWILFLPIALGVSHIYPWVPHEGIHLSHIVEAKRAYLNVGAFYLRALIYLVFWSALAWRLSSGRAMGKGAAGFSLLLFVLACSFASFDWYMSLEPEWFSSLYGGLFLVASLVTVLSASIVYQRFSGENLSPDVWHDLGKLLLMAVMLWAYLNFSQFLILWQANIPEEMTWYHHRIHGRWYFVGLGLVVFHFAVPFLLLLSRPLKRQGKTLAPVAGLLLVMRFVDWAYWVYPSMEIPGVAILASILGAILLASGVGGLIVARKMKEPVYEDRPVKR